MSKMVQVGDYVMSDNGHKSLRITSILDVRGNKAHVETTTGDSSGKREQHWIPAYR
jgi:hypothetical protein